MNPSDVDFYEQFNQGLSSPDGAIILDNGKNNKKKKLIIIAAAVVGILVAVALIMLFLTKSNPGKQDFGAASKEYAKYFIFGPQDNNNVSYYDLTSEKFYFMISGKDNQEYLAGIKSRINTLKNIAPSDEEKTYLAKQAEWFGFYEIAGTYLWNAESSNSFPEFNKEDANLATAYDAITNYVEKKKAEKSAEELYEEGSITEKELKESETDSEIAEAEVRAWRKAAYNKMAQCAKGFYEE